VPDVSEICSVSKIQWARKTNSTKKTKLVNC